MSQFQLLTALRHALLKKSFLVNGLDQKDCSGKEILFLEKIEDRWKKFRITYSVSCDFAAAQDDHGADLYRIFKKTKKILLNLKVKS